MKKKLIIILLISLASQLRAADYYWVGGAGNWSDLNHWRIGSSAGPIAGIVPAAGDNVFFDANSGFTAVSKTVTLNANGFCNNMTWDNVPNSPIFATADASFTVEVWGNMVLSPTTTYTCIFKFKGAAAATIATRGTVFGAFGIEIDKPGSSLAVTDSLIVPAAANVPTSYITLTSGIFNIAGKKVSHLRFYSDNTNARTLDMANADVTFFYYYRFYGANKTINASGSTLNALGWIYMDGGTYPRIFNDAYGDNIAINNTTIGSLTFRSANATSQVGIDAGNTVDSLIFIGQGRFCCNNTIGYLRFDKLGTFVGGNNNVRYVECHGGLNMGNVINTVDTLLLASNYTTNFAGSFNINKYLYVAGAACEAYTEINGDSTAGSINFAAGATVNINNVILTGVKATGPVTPIAVNGIDGSGNTGFTIIETSVAGTTLYWVGGAGDWNDRNHWSTASGGAGGACIPFTGDNVVFDANSGLATGTVTTSSASFCKDMTWTGIGNVTFSESATASFRIYGSLTMDNSVTMNSILEFKGNSNATITTSGSTLGTLQFIVGKTGAVSVTLADNWSNVSGSIIHLSGGLNMSGRTVSIYFYSSTSGLSRSLDISNATLGISNNWDYRGANKSIVSTGSYITASTYFRTDGLSYPKVDLTYTGGTSVFSIGSTNIDQLTFTSTGGTVSAGIAGNNTIRRLEFKGKGTIGAGGNIIDSLILAGSRNYTFIGTNTISKYLEAQATPCSGLTEIRGTGTLAFAGTAVVNMANIYMQNMTATGPITPIAVNGADAGGNTGWTITSAAGSPHYWIGGAGDWNDGNHWSSTTGGAGGTACVPTVYDDVYFDAGSGFIAASKTVTINNGNAYCHSINWTGALNNPTFSKSGSWNLEVWGDSAIFNPLTTLTMTYLTFKGSNATFVKGTPGGNLDIWLDKAGGSLTMLEDYNNSLTAIGLISGAFNAPGRTLQLDVLDNLGYSNATSIDISNAKVTTATGWNYYGPTAAHALNAAGSTITTPGFTANGFTYNKVNITGTAAVHGSTSNASIDSLIFTNTSITSTAGINGANNTLNYVEYKGSGGIYATGNIIDTLVFFPGNTYTLNAGTNTTITGEWFGSGTPCRPTEILSSSTSSNATVTKTSGTVDFDYIRLRRITAAGAATPFIAHEHSNNLGNNVNWNIEPYNGSAPMEGLGPDIAVHASLFPYTLNTDGFFGSPLSQYLWNDNSTRDTLAITGPGIYSVAVSFADGCSVSDEIVVSEAMTLPVTLISFKASTRNCQSALEWKVADAVNFSRFIVEQSKDGRQFTVIADISYTAGIDQYSYTDESAGNGTTFYRLKCVDADGKYKFSSVASVSTDCNTKPIHVYPTVTSNTVNVILPQGSEKAQLNIISTSGQRMNPVVQASGSVRTISFEGFPPAVYLLQVVNGRETKSFKIVKH
jgi:hypothetical protein